MKQAGLEQGRQVYLLITASLDAAARERYQYRMAVLSRGAVELPMSHVSVRVAWHDTDWTGRVCASPETNHACTVLKNVKENKNPEAEAEVRGTPWADLDSVPPCVNERAGFMRPRMFKQERVHNYAWNKRGAHAHFAPTEQRMPAYSLEVTPFRWVMLQEHERYSIPWNIGFDQGLEDRAHALMPFDEDTWIQDHRNQLALLDSFFSALRPRESLVFLYAKDLPLIEQREPGGRYLIGVGFVEGVDPVKEWEYSHEGELRSVMWERGVGHSIRPGNLDGFLLPYHALLANSELAGTDLEPFVARTPPEHFDEFSYVSELVSHDGAIAALTELARVVEIATDARNRSGQRTPIGERMTNVDRGWRRAARAQSRSLGHDVLDDRIHRVDDGLAEDARAGARRARSRPRSPRARRRRRAARRAAAARPPSAAGRRARRAGRPPSRRRRRPS